LGSAPQSLQLIALCSLNIEIAAKVEESFENCPMIAGPRRSIMQPQEPQLIRS
jgi:hypothetical protein